MNPEKNLWFDFGEGKGGNIFALAGEFIKTGDFLTQARYVAEVAGMPTQDYGPQKAVDTHRSDGHSFEDVKVLPLQNRALLHYLQERGIPSRRRHSELQGDTLLHARQAVFRRGFR